ncbi:MAG: site-2 protease family protein, partial [Planctomycetota bacterium]
MSWLRAFQVVIALGLLIFVHELGHFLAAKWSGVRVEVFSFGFGPFLLSFKRGETIYALSLIPFGGYVRMTGQVDVGKVKEEEKRLPYSYLAKSPTRRAVIIVAGVTMNIVFAYILFSFAHVVGIVDVPAEIG